jgi:diaminopimelate decarboxylase
MHRAICNGARSMSDRDEIDRWLELAADTHGTPAFVYFSDLVSERIGALDQAFDDGFDLSFAVKSNPNPGLLSWLRGRIGHLDVSSIGEFRLALAAGWDPSSISFTGPAKREPEMHEAIAGGIGLLIMESLREARLASAIARSLDRTQSVLVRIAPNHVPKGFGDQMAGRPSPFGIDEDDANDAIAEVQRLEALHLAGLHIYSGTQCLKATAIVELYRNFIALFRRLCQRHAITPERLIFGSGLGVAYHEQDTPLDLA